ncbi:MAG TPA: hypothetical protein VF084_06740 [Nitrososphaeraceae archaeon]
MTFPRGYQRPNKKNLDDKTDLINSSENTTKNEKDINPIPTTIGEAVKEVIETGKEVVIEGPQTAGELTGVKEGDLEEKNIDHAPKPSQNDNIALTDVRKDSKLEIDVIESPPETGFLSKEEKIIVNPKESKTEREANVTTVTTIPTEGVNVEAQTEFTVPLIDKEKNIEVETDVKVNPTTIPSSESSLDSRNIEKPNLSSTDELGRKKNPPQSEFDKETINPKLLLEKEEHRLREQNTSNFSSNPFITYSAFWQHIMSNWVSFYDEYLKNMIKFNELWFDKSKNIRSGSQQEQ